MSDDRQFKVSLVVIAALHVVVVAFLFLMGKWTAQPPQKEIIAWIDGSVGGGDTPGVAELQPASVEKAAPPLSAPEFIPSPEPEPEPLPPPVEKPAPSDIVTATPAPATPPPTPKPTPKPATPKPTPKPTPKATPKKTTPKPTPKASPTAKPKASPKPAAAEDEGAKPKATPSDKPKGTTSAAKTGASGSSTTLASNQVRGGNGPGSGNGKGPAKTGNGEGMTKYGWYFAMIDDRFTSRWAQPTNIERTGAPVTAMLKIRISADGTISEREIVQSSGYPQMDESVLSAAEKVLQIDPLPEGLGEGGFLELKVEFKLDQGQ